ncbi:hypothetical protein QQ045_023675 [Rhodiola kirilowii]
MTTPSFLRQKWRSFRICAESKRRVRVSAERMKDFNEFMLGAELNDVGFVGNPFTSSNNQSGDRRVWERLDRVLVNGMALHAFPRIQVTHLPRLMYSDHYPLLVESGGRKEQAVKLHYQVAWESHPSFMELVRSTWEGELNSNSLVSIGLKLRKLRNWLWEWNWRVFGDLKTKAREAALHVNVLEGRLQIDGWDNDVHRSLVHYRQMHGDITDQLLNMQRDKAHLSWLKEGDRNSKLFHAAMRMRCMQNRKQLDIGEEELTSDRDVIGGMPVSFYQDLFGGHSPPPSVENFTMFQKVLTNDDNVKLVSAPDAGEVLNEIKGMGLSSAPGPDGFTGHFFLSCWDIIRDDLMMALGGFVAGRSIHESIALAHDLVHDLNQKRGRSNVVIKLHMSKAYDRVSWSFIMAALCGLGFSERRCNLIFRCISNCYYSVR